MSAVVYEIEVGGVGAGRPCARVGDFQLSRPLAQTLHSGGPIRAHPEGAFASSRWRVMDSAAGARLAVEDTELGVVCVCAP